MPEYTYSIANDFINCDYVNNVILSYEITSNIFNNQLIKITVDGDSCNLEFENDLSADDQAQLILVIEGHYGTSAPAVTVVEENVVSEEPDVDSDVNTGVSIGDSVVNDQTNEVYVCVDNTPGQAEWKVIGGREEYLEDEEESQTTCTHFRTKSTMQINDAPAGYYKLDAYAEISSAQSTNVHTCEAVVEVNGTVVGNTRKKHLLYEDFRVAKRIYLEAGNHTIRVRYRTNRRWVAAKIRRTRINVRRIK